MSPDTGLDPWRCDVAGFVEAHLPAPPARVLELGCGDGWLCHRLDSADYGVRGIDPEAPEGELFTGVGLEDFDEPEPFDAVVAVLSLHHINDVVRAVNKISALLRPAGTVVVVEFAWDRFDDDAARWCLDRLPPELDGRNWLHQRCAPLRERLLRGEAPRATEHFQRWAIEEGFHSSPEMLEQLRRRFSERLLTWSPYLYPDLEYVTAEEERAAIDADEIRPTGFRFVGAAPARQATR